MNNDITINEQISLTDFYPEDKPNLVLYLNDPVVYSNTLTIPYPYEEADADKWLEIVAEMKSKHGEQTNWAIRDRTLGLVGGIGMFMHTGKDGHRDEIGYWLAAPLRGNGLMTQVVGMFCRHLFATRPLVRIEAWVYPENPASGRVLEKNGFACEGCARKYTCKKGEYRDAVLYGLIRE